MKELEAIKAEWTGIEKNAVCGDIRLSVVKRFGSLRPATQSESLGFRERSDVAWLHAEIATIPSEGILKNYVLE